jgi:hypothetical protein
LKTTGFAGEMLMKNFFLKPARLPTGLPRQPACHAFWRERRRAGNIAIRAIFTY